MTGALKTMTFIELDTGCYVCTSHKAQWKGYFRFQTRNEVKFFHRAIYEEMVGPIPEGHDVHHKCHVRLCCNIEHLEVLDKRAHCALTSHERYKPRKDVARAYWLEAKCTASILSRKFGVSIVSGSRWIREWKELPAAA